MPLGPLTKLHGTWAPWATDFSLVGMRTWTSALASTSASRYLLFACVSGGETPGQARPGNKILPLTFCLVPRPPPPWNRWMLMHYLARRSKAAQIAASILEELCRCWHPIWRNQNSRMWATQKMFWVIDFFRYPWILTVSLHYFVMGQDQCTKVDTDAGAAQLSARWSGSVFPFMWRARNWAPID